ncbi:MAG: hypothetical protein JSV18_03900 [Candidatus Bathyarchaeota archaeon]|nr:MAG: hypothetical protein JSV18_03900 [Candidatus Bathyarchaeota archaeon]
MRYIAFWDLDMEDTAKVVEKMRARKKRLKTILPPHGIGGQPKGFTIFETDDEQDLVEYIAHYGPELRIKIFPIWESSKTIAAWEKLNE